MSVLTGVIGWLLGLIELYVLSAALATLALGAIVAVRLRHSAVHVERRLRPSTMSQGEPGHGRLVISNPRFTSGGAFFRRTPPVVLTERIGAVSGASIEIGALPPGEQVTARYQVPTHRRGIVEIGPVRLDRTDPFRLARSKRIAVGVDEAVIAPATHSLGVPRIGSGQLGRHLAAAARRLGVGDFHSLREYVEGDEPRSIHWRASARTDDLKVRQFELPRLSHCTVILDTDSNEFRAARVAASTPTSNRGHDVDAIQDDFERAVSIAASIVVAASTELATRLIALPSIDVAGPTAGHDGLIELARVDLVDGSDRDADNIGDGQTDGLGLVVVVTPSPASALWSAMRARRNPTVTTVAVCTTVAGSQWNLVDGTTIERFLAAWHRLSGVDAPARVTIDWEGTTWGDEPGRPNRPKKPTTMTAEHFAVPSAAEQPSGAV